MLISGLELKIDLLVRRRGLSVDYIIVESDRLVFVNAANVPLIGPAKADLGVGDIRSLELK